MNNELILASESPRRRELLTQAGIAFTVMSAHAPEIKEGAPEEVALHNAVAKASAVAALCPGRAVLGADTIVYLDGHVFGKPADEADARAMLHALSGHWHQVYTGVALIDEQGQAHTNEGSCPRGNDNGCSNSRNGLCPRGCRPCSLYE